MTIRRIACAALLGIGAGLMTHDAHALEPYGGTKRPLLVFAPDAANADLVTQRRGLEERRAGVGERDMVVVYVVGDTVTAQGAAKPRADANRLRRQYGVARGAFRAVLIGKDGGVKQSSGRPIPVAALFGTIDAMPMRRDEMRRR